MFCPLLFDLRKPTIIFLLYNNINNLIKNATQKKTEHTRMYAQLCRSVNTIFTSVVVYSRTTQ